MDGVSCSPRGLTHLTHCGSNWVARGAGAALPLIDDPSGVLCLPRTAADGTAEGVGCVDGRTHGTCPRVLCHHRLVQCSSLPCIHRVDEEEGRSNGDIDGVRVVLPLKECAVLPEAESPSFFSEVRVAHLSGRSTINEAAEDAIDLPSIHADTHHSPLLFTQFRATELTLITDGAIGAEKNAASR